MFSVANGISNENVAPTRAEMAGYGYQLTWLGLQDEALVNLT
jgi:hypothetical protein